MCNLCSLLQVKIYFHYVLSQMLSIIDFITEIAPLPSSLLFFFPLVLSYLKCKGFNLPLQLAELAGSCPVSQ